MYFCPEKDYKHTCDTIYAHFQGITNNIYGFGIPFYFWFIFLPVHHWSTHISTRPYIRADKIPTGQNPNGQNPNQF